MLGRVCSPNSECNGGHFAPVSCSMAGSGTVNLLPSPSKTFLQVWESACDIGDVKPAALAFAFALELLAVAFASGAAAAPACNRSRHRTELQYPNRICESDPLSYEATTQTIRNSLRCRIALGYTSQTQQEASTQFSGTEVRDDCSRPLGIQTCVA